MSFFTLTGSGVSAAALAGFAQRAETMGFKVAHRCRHADLDIVLFDDLSGQNLSRLERPDGDFVVVLGSLIYRETVAPNCLADLLVDFDPATFAWQQMLGSHTILLRKGSNLYLFGDGLGATRLYMNAAHSVCSNSFLAMCEIAGPGRLDTQACYEYVIAGSVYGTRTLLAGVTALPANRMLQIDGHGRQQPIARPSPIQNEAMATSATLDDAAAAHCRQLDAVFGPIARNYPDRIRLSFSGGFDSRLMLAMLRRHGAKPTLFVYGDRADEDVRIAEVICRAEGLALERIDKGQVPALPPDAFIGETEKNLFAFDGWKVETTLFDFGADRNDRLARHADGQIPLNGSLGEIYRNFFYMPDRTSSIGAVISTFYSRYDPRALTGRFNERDYRAGMTLAMREAIGTDDERLARSQVEEVYPKFRGRYWTGRDAANNQRFGPMFFPYLEHAAISNTPRIPLRFKDLGRLQGRMIAHVDKRLADYPSDYGFALDGPRPLKYRIKTFLGTQRPPALRKRSFRLTHRHMEPRTGAIGDAYLAKVIDLEFPVMRRLFHIDAVNCATQYGLIATLEYLAERYDLGVADA